MSTVPETEELASRVLSNLYEAGAENVSSTLNTVIEPTGSDEEPRAMAAALASLLAAELIYLTRGGVRPGRNVRVDSREAQRITSELSAVLSFNADRKLWIWDDAVPMIELAVTEAGDEEAFRVLDERGYQWWRQQT